MEDSSRKNPCADCIKDTPDGVICDKCSKWFCISCVNAKCMCLSSELYGHLSKLKKFPWQCHHCSNLTLPKQLADAKIYTEPQLVAMGVPPEALKKGIDGKSLQSSTSASRCGSPPPTGAKKDTNIETLVKLLAEQLQDQKSSMEKMFHEQQKIQHAIADMTQHNAAVVQPVAPPVPLQPVLQSQEPETVAIQPAGTPIIGPTMGPLESPLQQPNVDPTQVPVNSVAPRATLPQQQNPLLRLPKIQLPEFNGEIHLFKGWWESFNTNVHSRDIDEKLKWDYLMSIVKGPAYRKIEGLGLSSVNYQEAIKILKQIYGREDLLKPQLWLALEQLKPIKPSLENLEEFTDVVRAKTTALKQLGVSQDTLDEYTALLLHKLPLNLKSEMEKMQVMLDQISPGSIEKGWKLDRFLSALFSFQQIGPSVKPKSSEKAPEPISVQSTLCGQSQSTVSSLLQAADKKPTNKQFNKFSSRSSQSSVKFSCLFCDGNHFSDACRRVPNVKERLEVAKAKKACFKCLSVGSHMAKDCNRDKKCFFCSSVTHHSAFCYKRGNKMNQSGSSSNVQRNYSPVCKFATDSAKSTKNDKRQENKNNAAAIQGYQGFHKDLSESCDPGLAAMATMPACLVNPITGQEVHVTTYLDGGAETTTIRSTIADKMGLIPVEQITMSTARFGDNVLQDIEGNKVQFVFRGPGGYQIPMNGLSVPVICPKMILKPIPLSPTEEEMLQKHYVVNRPPEKSNAVEVDLLVGQDYYNIIMHSPGTQVFCLSGSLRIHQTPFGGILSGCPTQTVVVSKKKSRMQTKVLMLATNKDVDQLWSLETIGIKSDESTRQPQSKVQKFFSETITRLEDGRYEVRLPFKENAAIDSNFKVAFKRLQSVLRKICPDGSVTTQFEKYNDIFQDQLKQGIIEPVTWKRPVGKILHYVSHFPVVKESSATTKVRIVIDPSAKTKTGICLNDLLYVGPNLMEDLTGLLLRFRLPAIIMVSDIAKAFLQVSVYEEDRDAVRFLWLKDATKPNTEDNLQVFRYTRVPFGVSSSPFLLIATIEHHLQQSNDPVALKFKNSIYMDNAFLPAEQPSQCMQLYHAAKKLFWSAQMNLREWNSNCQEFNKSVPADDKANGTDVKVLGLVWQTQSDSIKLQKVSFDCEAIQTPTKRIVLHRIAKIFDPLGFMNPVTIRGRILMQALWKVNLEWDSVLPEEQRNQWNLIQQDLLALSEIEFPRRVIADSSSSVELLCFTDASPAAYACVVYLRQNSSVELVFSKAKVAPIKPMTTVPRLELLSILIGVRAMKFVESQIKMPVSKRFLWNDSQIAIAQVKSDKLQPPWIQRRVDDITSAEPFSILYIPGHDNPADLATRGITTKKMLESTWYHGPKWLQLAQKDWPMWTANTKDTPVENVQLVVANSARKSDKKTIQNEELQGPFGIAITKFSSLQKLFRVTALCQHFIDILQKKKPKQSPIEVTDIQLARNKWLRSVQSTHFSESLDLVKKGKFNQFVKQLDLFVDDSDGLLRCGGRLANAPLTYDSRFPILLPKESHLTKLVVLDAHEKAIHFKAKHTLAQIRQSFWIPAGLTTIKKILQSCIICQRLEGGAFKPPRMGQLPPERLEKAPAWKYTALDFLGPLLIKEPGKDSPLEKRWVALFTCFSSRAIHLEVVQDCSTNAVVRALERFISRRGTPKFIMSDNQASFLAAAKSLKLIFDKQVSFDNDSTLQPFFRKKGIIWKTIPERSPWFNGLTERLVGLVKRALKKILWRATCTAEEFQTLLIKIEGVLNCRPLLSDVEDGILTPANFIAPGTQLGFPPSDDDPNDPDWRPNTNEAKDLLGTYTKNQKRLDSFWKIFHSQYLNELREAHRINFKPKKGEIARKPNIGEVCLIRDVSVPRLCWPLVRIVELLPGQDNELRYVKVKLPSGTITRRGVQDLVPLEVAPDKASDGSASPTLDQSKNSSSNKKSIPMKKTKLLISTLSVSLIVCYITFWCMILPVLAIQNQLSNSTLPNQTTYTNSTFQICLHGPGGRKLKLPQKKNCKYPMSSEHKRVNVTVFVPNSQWPNSTAYLCYKERTTVCTTVGFIPGPPVLTNPGTVVRSSATFIECKTAAKSMTFNGIQLHRDKALPTLYTTGKKVDIKSRWWSTVCSHVDNFIIEMGEVASNDGTSVSSNLLSTEHCTLQNGSCELVESILIWSLRSIIGYCPYVRKGIYSARFNSKDGTFISIPSIQGAYHLTQKRGLYIHACLPKTAYLSEEGVIIYFGVHYGNHEDIFWESSRFDSTPTEFKRLQDNLALTASSDPVNSKLNYLIQSISESIEERFRHDYYLFCLLAQRELDLAIQMLEIDTTRGVRALLSRNDVSAEFSNGTVYVHQCHSVTVDSIYFDHRHPITGKCHEFVPVKLHDSVWYLTKGSKDLVPFSPEIPCSRVHPITHSQHSNYVIEIPNLLMSTESKIRPIPIFLAPPIFKSRVILPPEAIRAFSSSMLGINRRLQATINFTAQISTEPGAIREFLSGIGQMGDNLIEGAGNALGGLVHDSLEGVGDFIGHIISPWFVIAIGIILAMLLLGLVCYCLFHLQSSYKLSQRIKRAKQLLETEPELDPQTSPNMDQSDSNNFDN